ncbi:MAG TPA: conjugal transfer protein TraF, partial [Candidatus Nitrosotenuis sp.]|nr:conjugal transfer protein TraF [Candidatus Nitrosotenuis sp.]
MVNSKILISLWLILVVSPSFAESWVSSPQKGWLWYKKVPKKIINHPDAGKKTTSSSKDPVSYRSQLKKFKEQLEEVQAKAVLMPTLENVHAFQVAQAKAINQASAFQEIWMLASMLSGNGYRDS